MTLLIITLMIRCLLKSYLLILINTLLIKLLLKDKILICCLLHINNLHVNTLHILRYLLNTLFFNIFFNT